MKTYLQPLARNKVMVRLENLYDNFDANAQAYTLLLSQLAEELWRNSNSGPMPSYKMVETSVTGNMPVEEMESRRINWKTASKNHKRQKKDRSVDGDKITIEPQMIRVFVLEFTPDQIQQILQ